MSKRSDAAEKGLYRRVEVRTWGDEKFNRLSRIPPSGQSLWLFLLTGPHTGSLPGLFRAGRLSMSEDLEWLPERFDESFEELSREGMAKADWKARVVWIPNAIKHNPPANPNVVKSWKQQFDLIPECPLKLEAWETLSKAVRPMGEGFAGAFDAWIRKPCANGSGNGSTNGSGNGSGNQEQLTGTGAGTGGKPSSSSSRAAPNVDTSAVPEIFAYWQKTMASPRSRLDDKRREAIVKALQLGYTPRDLCKAIRGCSLTPHNMGTNDSSQKYNGIALILRDAEHIDRFIANDTVPPRTGGSLTAQDRVQQQNAETIRAFLGEQTAPSDPMTIDMEH